jgi:hypothetical protein
MGNQKTLDFSRVSASYGDPDRVRTATPILSRSIGGFPHVSGSARKSTRIKGFRAFARLIVSASFPRFSGVCDHFVTKDRLIEFDFCFYISGRTQKALHPFRDVGLWVASLFRFCPRTGRSARDFGLLFAAVIVVFIRYSLTAVLTRLMLRSISPTRTEAAPCRRRHSPGR